MKVKTNILVNGEFYSETFSRNGINFVSNDLSIPSYNRIKEFAIEIASYVTYHRCLAMDIMIDQKEYPRLIEFNISGLSTWFYPFAGSPMFGKYTDEIIEYCYKNKRKAEKMSNVKKILYTINRCYNYVLALGVSKIIANREVSEIMKISRISNQRCKNEEAWVRKWSALSGHVNRKYYRTFSKYIGEDINIVPDDICHNVIEPILNPIRYRSLYEDKCMFDKFLFKQFAVSVTPRTLLRNINGIYYDENYNELDKDKIDIVSMFCSFDKLIVKPSIDSSSGRNILFFDKNIDGLFVNKGSGETLSIPFRT